MTKIQKFKTILVACALSFVAIPVFAVDVFFLPEMKSLRPEEIYEAKIFFSSSEKINAFEGKILFSEDNLKVEETRDGNSLINLWIERPKEKEKGVIYFSGITPGGFVGENGYLFSIIFRATSIGNGLVEIKDIKALKNDGNGTPAEVRLKSLVYKISGEVIGPESASLKKPIIIDNEPPETFVPEIAQDQNLFGGEYFLVFVTQDKISGVTDYAVYESRRVKKTIAPNKWIEVENLYTLKDQKLRSWVYVKAVDRAGNERIVKIAPRNPLAWYENYFINGIIILGIVVAYRMIKNLWSRFTK